MTELRTKIAEELVKVTNRWIAPNFPTEHKLRELAELDEREQQLNLDYADAAIAAMPGWQPVETYPGDDSVVLVANPAEGTLPVIAWRIEDAWFAYDLSKREPLTPKPTIWMAWPKMSRPPAPIPQEGDT